MSQSDAMNDSINYEQLLLRMVRDSLISLFKSWLSRVAYSIAILYVWKTKQKQCSFNFSILVFYSTNYFLSLNLICIPMSSVVRNRLHSHAFQFRFFQMTFKLIWIYFEQFLRSGRTLTYNKIIWHCLTTHTIWDYRMFTGNLVDTINNCATISHTRLSVYNYLYYTHQYPSAWHICVCFNYSAQQYMKTFATNQIYNLFCKCNHMQLRKLFPLLVVGSLYFVRFFFFCIFVIIAQFSFRGLDARYI